MLIIQTLAVEYSLRENFDYNSKIVQKFYLVLKIPEYTKYV